MLFLYKLTENIGLLLLWGAWFMMLNAFLIGKATNSSSISISLSNTSRSKATGFAIGFMRSRGIQMFNFFKKHKAPSRAWTAVKSKRPSS